MVDADRHELTTLECIVLGLLSTGPETTPAILQKLEKIACQWNTSVGSIYPAFRRLEKQGMIEDVSRTPHARKTYHITPEGAIRLDLWLTAPLTNDEMLNDREVPMIKFLFAEQRLSRREVLKWLEAYERQMDSYYQLHHFWHDAQIKVSSPHQQLLIQATDMELDMQRRWIQLVRQSLSNDATTVLSLTPALMTA